MDLLNSNVIKRYFESFLVGQHAPRGHSAVFISFTNGKERAFVVKSRKASYEESFISAFRKMTAHCAKNGISPIWIKVDCVCDSVSMSYAAFKKNWLAEKLHYYRKGFSVDEAFHIAFLEEEINANAFVGLSEKSNARQVLWKNLQYYLYEHQGYPLDLDERMIRTVEVFDTKSFFTDGQTFVDLEDEAVFKGQRGTARHNLGTIYEVISKTSGYLENQILDDGKLVYGYYPYFDREIEGYNIVRHILGVKSLVKAYGVTQSPSLREQILRAIHYVLREAYWEKIDETGRIQGFILERAANDEIKLGAQAAMIMLLCEWRAFYKEENYTALASALVNGLYAHFQEGMFKHVLAKDTLEVIETFRYVDYEGMAIYALTRFYDWQGGDHHLDFASSLFDRYVALKYDTFANYWMSLASCYLCRLRPSQTLFDFNLSHASHIIPFAEKRETPYLTVLSLFIATHKLILWHEKMGKPYTMPKGFDETVFYDILSQRVVQGFSGYMYPEVAMYFKAPSKSVHAFYTRHQGFRIRIDDVEQALNAYVSFYSEYNAIKKRRKQ